ncbi:MAG: chromate resistance protein [Bryobacteraceae bacterium]|nr:chromate resistance protein [Bryobacteraceae bacterium]
MRRIKQLGALAVKKSAYVLPDREDTGEDFEWLRKEILAGGGEAWILRGEFLAGLTHEELIRLFQDDRSHDYEELLAGGETNPARIRKRLAEIVRIDFFDAPGKDKVMELLKKMESPEAGSPALSLFPRGATWVTRRGVKVDRMSSAWLIRRHLDPAARFRFVDPAEYVHQPGEIRFDMYEGEYTHQDDRCTFEVLLHTAGLDTPSLRSVAEMVHDLDLKDGKFQRPETAGFAAMLEGIIRRFPQDADRLEHSAVLLDTIAAGFA